MTVEDDVFYVCFVVLAAGCFLSGERALRGFVCLNDWVCLDRKGNYATTTLGLSDVAFNVKPFFLLLKYFNFFFVVNSSEDGWWEAENAAGKQGVVPKTLLKVTTGSFELVCIIILLTSPLSLNSSTLASVKGDNV